MKSHGSDGSVWVRGGKKRSNAQRDRPSRKIISNLVLIDTDNPAIRYAIQRKKEEEGER